MRKPEMPQQEIILKYNHVGRSIRFPFIIYAESILEKINAFHNNPEKSSTARINSHIPSGYF